MVTKVIIVIIIIRDKMVILVEMVIIFEVVVMIEMVRMVEIIIMVEERQDRQDRHVNLTFQVTCVLQLSQFLRCF